MLCSVLARNRFASTPPARLLRDVPAKPEGFLLGTQPARSELRSFVASCSLLAALNQESLRFFRPIA